MRTAQIIEQNVGNILYKLQDAIESALDTNEVLESVKDSINKGIKDVDTEIFQATTDSLYAPVDYISNQIYPLVDALEQLSEMVTILEEASKKSIAYFTNKLEAMFNNLGSIDTDEVEVYETVDSALTFLCEYDKYKVEVLN